MTNQHPITPPPELVRKWHDEAKSDPCGPTNWVAVKAAQWGADQELEACCQWISDDAEVLAEALRIARRPKPPSLADEALDAQQRLWDGVPCRVADWQLIRRALERLQELEGGNG